MPSAEKDIELGHSKLSKDPEREANGQPQPKVEYDEHEPSLETLEERLGVTLDHSDPSKSKGLSKAEAAQRLSADGPNALTPPAATPWYVQLALKFLDPFMLLLEMAGLLCFILYGTDVKDPANRVNLWVAIVLVVVVTITSFLAYYQEGQSAKVMASFQKMMSDKAKVRRDGAEIDVPSTDIVRGDLIVLESGQRVPADIRLVATDSLKVENSSFTGEPEPVELCLEKTDDDALHSKNLAFNSAMVVEGKGLGLCVRTGDRTMIGSIASLVGQTKGGKSTLEAEVIGFVNFITRLGLISATLLYLITIIRECAFHVGGKCDPGGAFITVFIVILIANVPEGLPATVTSCLTVCAQRLAARHVFVKRLDCVETLGSCNVVASDKTGTLTQNKMTVSHVWIDQRVRTAEFITREANLKGWESFAEVVTTGSLCNMCKFEEEENARPSLANRSHTQRTMRGASQLQGLSANSNQYTLSKKPPPNMVAGGTYVQYTAGASMAQNRPEDAPVSILQPGFFEKGQLPSQADSSTTNSTAVTAPSQGMSKERSLAHAPDIVRQLSNLHSVNSTVSRNQATVGRQKSAPNPLATPPSRKVVGNPSDAAIFNFCHMFKDVDETRRDWPQLYIIPFNSRLKWMKTIHRPPSQKSDQRRMAILKGAPEIIMQSCTHHYSKGQDIPIDEIFKHQFDDVYKEIASQGERVLGFARKFLDLSDFPASCDNKYKEKESSIPHDGYTFVGLISLVDPPKHGVPDAVLRCKNAGIRVIMITGDHPLTAEAIAKKVNIIRDFSMREDIAHDTGEDPASITEDRIGAAVIFCKELEHYSEENWKVLLDKPELVFARASPQDKLTIVKHLRARDDVVAVTGDGVNDSPALKNADIGIAMGIMGTEVAKSAANVVLMDDNFCSIVNGIEEGRVLFDNLTKTIGYTLTHAVPELVAVIINILFSIPYGMSTLMILSIDLLSEVAPAISFAWEKSESIVMDRMPRNRKIDRLVRPSLLMYSYLQAGIIEAGICLFAYFMSYRSNGITAKDLHLFGTEDSVTLADGRTLDNASQTLIVNEAMTAYYACLVLSQFIHVFVCKTRFVPMLEHGIFGNTLMNYGVLIELGILSFIVFVPGLDQVFFSYQRLPIQFFCFFLVSGTILIVWGELRKYLVRRYPTSWFAHWISF